MSTKAFSKEYPHCDLHFLSHSCVWVGVKGIRPFWLPWLYALFWLGLIFKSVVRKEGRGAWLAYDEGERRGGSHGFSHIVVKFIGKYLKELKKLKIKKPLDYLCAVYEKSQQ